VGDWPVKICLQKKYANRRNYERKCEERNIEAAEGVAYMDNIFDFGSDKENE